MMNLSKVGKTVAASAILLSTVNNGWAGNLNITPSIALAYNQSDNITLAGTNEIADSVAELTPGLNLNYQGGRTLTNIDYQSQSLRYADNKANDEDFQQLSSLFNSEVISQLFWLNMAYSIEQRTINDTADQLQGNIFANGNNTNVRDAVVQPILRARRDNINFELIAEFGQQRFDDSGNADIANQFDSDTESYNISVNSDNQGSRFNWGINTVNNKTTFSDNSENKTRSAELQANIGITDQLLFASIYGQDDNDIDTTNEELLQSNYWSSSLTWNPNNRSSLNVATGERFGQPNSTVFFTYQNRAWNIVLSSNRELLVSGQDNAALLNPTPNQNVNNPVINNPVIRRNNSLAITYNRSKFQFNLSYSEDDRESQLINSLDEIDKNTNFSTTWRIQSRSSISFSYAQNEDQVPNINIAQQRTDKVILQTLTFNRQISANSELSLLIRSQKRESTNATFDYNEEGYQLNFSHLF